MPENDKKCVQIFGRRTSREEPLGRHRRRQEDNIRIDLGELVWECVDWTYLARDKNQWRALVNMVMNFRVP
jgi:hypothetical protein